MCNRARFAGEPETLCSTFGGGWLTDKPRDNRFDPKELRPKSRAYVVREHDGGGALWVNRGARRTNAFGSRMRAHATQGAARLPVP